MDQYRGPQVEGLLRATRVEAVGGEQGTRKIRLVLDGETNAFDRGSMAAAGEAAYDRPAVAGLPLRLLQRYWHNSKLVIELARPADMAIAFGMLLGAFLLTNVSSMDGGVEEFLLGRMSSKNIFLLATFAIVWPIVFSAFGLYNTAQIRTPWAESVRVFGACSLISASTVLLLVTGSSGAFRGETIVVFWVASIAGTLAMRHAIRAALGVPLGGAPRQVLIVGSGPRAVNLYRQLSSDPQGRCEIVGFVDSTDRPLPGVVERRQLGGLDQLESILMHRVVDEVMIALPIRSCYEQIQAAIAVCERAGVESRYLADVFQYALARPSYHQDDGAPVVTLKVVADDLRLLVKRAIDIGGAAIGLVVLAPVLLAVAVAVKLTSPGPVLFVQKRYGHHKRVFDMYKFRTMVAGAEAMLAAVEHLNEAKGPIFKIRDDPRLTPIGGFLRRSSLDELPQLFNVLIGQMSLVGPRPMSTRDVGRFSEAWLMRRFSVRPGMTGLWQVSGRSELAFDDWVALDLRYIDQWSLTLDLRILLATVPVVLRGTGAE